MSTLCYTLIILLGLGAVLKAEPLFNENFSDGVNGWTFLQINGDSRVVGPSLSYEGVNSAGQRLELRPVRDDLSALYVKPLAQEVKAGTVWCSYLLKADTVGIGHCFLRLGGDQTSIGKMWGPNFSIHNKPSNIPIEAGRTYRLVARFDLKEGNDDVWMWIDPSSDAEPDTSQAILHEGEYDIPVLDKLLINCRGPGNPVYAFDEIRVGTIWDDVSDAPRGPFDVEVEGPQGVVGGEFFVKYTLPVDVKKPLPKYFRTTNGKISKIFGSGREYTVVVKPSKKGKVSLALGRNMFKSLRGDTNKNVVTVSAQFDPKVKWFKPALSQAVSNYQKSIAGDRAATLWEGTRTVLVIEKGATERYSNPIVISKIVDALDRVVKFYDDFFPHKPKDNQLYQGQYVRIEVSQEIEMITSQENHYGIAIPLNVFEEFYRESARDEVIFPSEILSALADNYWMRELDLKIDYAIRSRKHGFWKKAFGHVMALEVANKLDLELLGSRREFERELSSQLNSFTQGKRYSWYNSFNVDVLPWNKNFTVDHLMAGVLLDLKLRYKKQDLLKSLYQEILKLDNLKSLTRRVDARNNFYLAVSRAVGEDCKIYFKKTLKWPVTEEACRQFQRESSR